MASASLTSRIERLERASPTDPFAHLCDDDLEALIALATAARDGNEFRLRRLVSEATQDALARIDLAVQLHEQGGSSWH